MPHYNMPFSSKFSAVALHELHQRIFIGKIPDFDKITAFVYRKVRKRKLFSKHEPRLFVIKLMKMII